MSKTRDCAWCDKKCKNEYCGTKCIWAARTKAAFEAHDLLDDLVGLATTTGVKVKAYLISRNGAACSQCGWCAVNPVTGKIPTELDHIDGNSDNWLKSNLRLICPNCHALTPTYKNLNKGNGRHTRRQRYHEGKSW